MPEISQLAPINSGLEGEINEAVQPSEIIQATNPPTNNVPTPTINETPTVSTTIACTHNTWNLSTVPNETYVTMSWRDCSGQPQVKAGIKSSIGNEFQADGSDFHVVYNPPLGTSVITENPLDVVPPSVPPTASVTITNVPLIGNGIAGMLGSLGGLGGGSGAVEEPVSDKEINASMPNLLVYLGIALAIVVGYKLIKK